MTPTPFLLLQNEGYLMQGCFKSSLKNLRQAQNGERGQFYSACFNYAIGLERLLKVLLLLDHWHRERNDLVPDIGPGIRGRCFFGQYHGPAESQYNDSARSAIVESRVGVT